MQVELCTKQMDCIFITKRKRYKYLNRELNIKFLFIAKGSDYKAVPIWCRFRVMAVWLIVCARNVAFASSYAFSPSLPKDIFRGVSKL